MPNFTVVVSGLQQVEQDLQRKIDVLQDLAPALMQGAQEVGRVEEELFQSGDRGQWAPITVNTQAYKAQIGSIQKPLQRTGAIHADLTTPRVLRSGPSSITVGTDWPYAAIQQSGFVQRWRIDRRGGALRLLRRTTPGYNAPRKLVDLTSSDRARIVAVVLLDLRRRLGTHP